MLSPWHREPEPESRESRDKRWRLDRLAWQMTTARLTRQSGGDVRAGVSGTWQRLATSRFQVQHLCPRPCTSTVDTYLYLLEMPWPLPLSGRTSVTHPSSHRRAPSLAWGCTTSPTGSCQLFVAGARLCAAGLEKRQRGGEKPATRIGALVMGRVLPLDKHAWGGSHRHSISTVLCRLPLPVSPASHSPCVPGRCLELLPQRLGTSCGVLVGQRVQCRTRSWMATRNDDLHPGSMLLAVEIDGSRVLGSPVELRRASPRTQESSGCTVPRSGV